MNKKTHYTKCYQATDLAAFVDGITFYEFSKTDPVHLSPGGYFELIFQFGDFFQTYPNSSQWYQRPKAFLGGLHHTSFAIRPKSTTNDLISVRFKTRYARFFLPGRLNTYQNRVVDLEDIFGAKMYAIHERLNEMDRVPEKLAEIERFLKSIMQPQNASPIESAIDIMKANKGKMPLTDVLDKIPLGASQFRKRFGEEIGLSPKAFNRILRINGIKEVLEQKTNVSLTDIAYEFNYFDQAHFTRDFQTVVGTSPGKYIESFNI